MVVALLALSLVMILGGAAAVVQGFPYVRLESGLAMVIGGSTAASAGVILLGLTAVLDRLRKLQRALSSLQHSPQAIPGGETAPWESGMPAPSQASLPMPARPAPEVQPPERSSLGGPGAAGLGAAGLAGLSVGALRLGGRGSEPVFDDPPAATDPAASAAEPLLPNLLAEPPPSGAASAASLDDDLFRASEPEARIFPEPEPPVLAESAATEEAQAVVEPQIREPEVRELDVREPLGLRPSLDEQVAAPQAETVESAEATTAPVETISDEPAHAESVAPEPVETPAAPEGRHAVGSYASGANTYVMFSDGSIEADTPRGRFTFASLDELKSFVNAGGEEARGAA